MDNNDIKEGDIIQKDNYGTYTDEKTVDGICYRYYYKHSFHFPFILNPLSGVNARIWQEKPTPEIDEKIMRRKKRELQKNINKDAMVKCCVKFLCDFSGIQDEEAAYELINELRG